MAVPQALRIASISGLRRVRAVHDSVRKLRFGFLVNNYVSPEDVAKARRLFDAKMRGDTTPFQFKLRREDGSAVWVDVQGTPLFNAAGVFRGIVGYLQSDLGQVPKKLLDQLAESCMRQS